MLLSTKRRLSSFFSMLLVMSVICPVFLSVNAEALPNTEISVAVSPAFAKDADAETSVSISVPLSVPTNFSDEPEPAAPVLKEAAPVIESYQPVFDGDVTLGASTVTESLLRSYQPLGRYKLSFYCPCRKCNGNSHKTTASGTSLTEGRTIAVDKNVIPLGSLVHIDGFGDFIAEDTGSSIKNNKIDVYVSTHAEAMRLGIKYANVYIKVK